MKPHDNSAFERALRPDRKLDEGVQTLETTAPKYATRNDVKEAVRSVVAEMNGLREDMRGYISDIREDRLRIDIGALTLTLQIMTCSIWLAIISMMPVTLFIWTHLRG